MRPTKRAPDVWDSAAFSSIFLASSFFCSQALSTPAHTQVTQTVRRMTTTHYKQDWDEIMTNNDEQEFTEYELNDLRTAKALLEYPSLTAKIADLVGTPIETGFKYLPKNWNQKIGEITQSALLKGLEFSILTMGKPETKESQDWLHKLLVMGSGAAGGAVGLASMSVELPFSTCVILRSIADIARSEEHNIALLETKLECLQVLALGGKNAKDDASESGYWMVRGALAKSVSEATVYIAEKGLAEEGAPPLIKLITTIASRFSVVITEEAAAKTIPIVGAISGGAINYLFMNHFQGMARGHFMVKRLEKKYGMKHVEKTYKELVI
ncbi:MAG TPA: EcsC family protein [Anaerolineales bacterium]|nr:EcsC family protein [Anaerolineales bacterium]